MVSEFKTIQEWPSQDPLPPLPRKLSTLSPGCIASEGFNLKETLDGKCTIGIHRSPSEFIEAALEIGHPSLTISKFPSEIAEVVQYNSSMNSRDLAQHRTAEMRRWVSLTEELKTEEKKLKESLGQRRSEILYRKEGAAL